MSRVRAAAKAAVDFGQEASGRIRFRLGRPPWPAPIFVIGTGRSGTHWVGQILDSHPQIAASIERPRFFRLSTAIALDPRTSTSKFDRLVWLYRYEIARVAPRHFADKSHPNIWIADRLAEQLPDAVFVGVHRSVYGTVASMLKHPGVSNWVRHWQRYPLPNRFLGIDADEGDWYAALQPAAQAALRWVSHEKRFAELRSVLGSRLVEVNYEQLHTAPSGQLAPIATALKLDSPIPAPSPKPSSLNRWQSELTREEIAAIEEIVGLKLP